MEFKIKDMLYILKLKIKEAEKLPIGNENYCRALKLFSSELRDNFDKERTIMTKEEFEKTIENMRKVFPQKDYIIESVFLHRFYLSVNSVVSIAELI